MAKIPIQNTRFGKIEVDESKLLDMPAGILGYQNSNRFALIDHQPDSPFKWLQSVEEPKVAFVVADPKVFFPDYDVRIKKEELANLDFDDGDSLIIYVILTLGDEPSRMTANLQGPIIINARNLKGRQMVIKGKRYSTRHKLFDQK